MRLGNGGAGIDAGVRDVFLVSLAEEKFAVVGADGREPGAMRILGVSGTLVSSASPGSSPVAESGMAGTCEAEREESTTRALAALPAERAILGGTELMENCCESGLGERSEIGEFAGEHRKAVARGRLTDAGS